MDSTASILARQNAWAGSAGLVADQAGYLPTWRSNLFQTLSQGAEAAFSSGAGSELLGTGRGSPKMAALHSSAALAVNVFDYWTGRSLESLAAALALDETPVDFRFEATFSTGLRGTPPTLDVAFRFHDSKVVGVESKFTEWLTTKSHFGNNFSTSYFPPDGGLWKKVGLLGAQALADALHAGEERFVYLDAAQLLKHMLGLANQHRGTAALLYIFYDWPAGPESAVHHAEISRFSRLVGIELPFAWATYQGLFERLALTVTAEAAPYIEYLQRRYASGAA